MGVHPEQVEYEDRERPGLQQDEEHDPEEDEVSRAADARTAARHAAGAVLRHRRVRRGEAQLSLQPKRTLMSWTC